MRSARSVSYPHLRDAGGATSKRVLAIAVIASLATATAACTGNSTMPPAQGYGSNPTLPSPSTPLIPTVNTADAKGWPAGGKPVPASGLAVNAFAVGLDHPRWLYTLPNGDVLVAETDAPPKPDDAKGIRGWAMKHIMKNAGSGVPSPNRISLLRDTDGDGVAETKTVLLSGLNSPFGMALVGDSLFVADTDALLRFPYHEGDTHIDAKGERVTDLPAGTINHHWTKNVIASPDGAHLYVTVGSNSNVAENGLDAEKGRAAIWEVDAAAHTKRPYATGLRNPNGMGWEPQSQTLWVAVNERDELGNDLVPDYITSVKDGGFYGWPFSYYGAHVDDRVDPQDPAKVATAIVPDYAMGSHTASLGLTFYASGRLPAQYDGGAFVGQHGSWNRKPAAGYRVVFVPFRDGRPAGEPQEVLGGFLDASGDAQGRPVGVAIDKPGDLLVADDVGGRVWRVTAAR